MRVVVYRAQNRKNDHLKTYRQRDYVGEKLTVEDLNACSSRLFIVAQRVPNGVAEHAESVGRSKPVILIDGTSVRSRSRRRVVITLNFFGSKTFGPGERVS